MKKVTVLLSISHKASNGLSSFVNSFVGQKHFFSQQGIDLNVFSRESYQQSETTIIRNVKKNKSLKNIVLNIVKECSLLSILYDYFMESRTAKKAVDQYIKSERIDDLVHCQEYHTCYYLLKKKKSQKVILTIHSGGEEFSMLYTARPGLNTWLGRKYLYHRFNYVIKHVYGIGHVSGKSQEIFSNNHPEFDKKKLFYVYNGIPVLPYNHNIINKKIQFICVGSLSDRKNQLSLLKAILLLNEEERAKMELVLVGDGEIYDKINTFKTENKLSNVILKGNCTNVSELLKEADIFILASKDEGFPIAIVEATREGLPIIGSRIAGIPEQIIDNVSGLIIDTTPESIAKAIKVILNKSEDEIMKMGEKSRELFMNKFSDITMFSNYSKIYNNAIEERTIF